MDIRVADLDSAEFLALLGEHLASLAPTAPAESRHALDLTGLRAPDVTVWWIRDGSVLVGFGALKQLTAGHGEVKSMRTASSRLRQGVASRMLRHIIQEAVARGYSRLSLETGSMAFFEPARRLYASFGFVPCEPFGSYQADPNSVFMTLQLGAARQPGRVAAGLRIASPESPPPATWEGSVPPEKLVAQNCFIVLYRWRLHPGTEEAFVRGWTRLTELLRARGSLGSRLHRGSDGLWYSYAQWPSAQVRKDIFALGELDAGASATMKSAIAEHFPEVILDAVADYIVPLESRGA